MNKIEELEKIAAQIDKCKICKENKIGKPVAGEGNPSARIVFIGEAPGKQEAKTGRPFIGRSGQLLRSEIRSIGLIENEVYITSPVKYLPVHGTPTFTEIEHGRIHLFKQLEIIRPKLIVLLGSVASFAILKKKIQVSKKHGQILKTSGFNCLITFHPAAALRFPNKIKKLLQKDFRKIKNFAK